MGGGAFAPLPCPPLGAVSLRYSVQTPVMRFLICFVNYCDVRINVKGHLFDVELSNAFVNFGVLLLKVLFYTAWR